jgi:hypothetical protein
MGQDLSRGVIMDNDTPAYFDSYQNAWIYISIVMSKQEHPRFMWISKEAA